MGRSMANARLAEGAAGDAGAVGERGSTLALNLFIPLTRVIR